MEKALVSKYDDIVKELKDSFKSLKEVDSTVQLHQSKEEFKEVLSESSSSGSQTIFCVIKLRSKKDLDDKSSRSSPYIMFHSTRLFKKSELRKGTFPVCADNHHSSLTTDVNQSSQLKSKTSKV